MFVTCLLHTCNNSVTYNKKFHDTMVLQVRNTDRYKPKKEFQKNFKKGLTKKKRSWYNKFVSLRGGFLSGIGKEY